MGRIAGLSAKKEVSVELSMNSDTCAYCPPYNSTHTFAQRKKASAVLPKTQTKEPCSWFEIHELVRSIASQIKQADKKYDCILAISTGGIIPAKLLAEELAMDKIAIIPFRNKKLISSEMPILKKNVRYLAVDDIYDTGSTFKQAKARVRAFNCDFAFCMTRFSKCPGFFGRVLNHERWIVFPWEKEIK